MAQKIVTIYTDDLTGEESSEAAAHIFTLDGVTYEVDLGPDSYDKLLDALAPFMTVGRKTGRQKKAAGRGTNGKKNDTAMIRAWAIGNGYDVNDRGRVPVEIREAFENNQ